jgi:hypothetical protein
MHFFLDLEILLKLIDIINSYLVLFYCGKNGRVGVTSQDGGGPHCFTLLAVEPSSLAMK